MNLNRFEQHLKELPAFECTYAGDTECRSTFLARVRHQCGRPATSSALAKIETFIPGAPRILRDFYELHDGLVMYRDTIARLWGGRKVFAAGLRFFPVELWQSKSDEVRGRYARRGFLKIDWPEWLRIGVAFGDVPNSGNYLMMAYDKNKQLVVHYVDHEVFESKLLADDFGALTELIVSDPAAMLRKRLGCHVRYCDGQTDKQWIPQRYIVSQE